MHFFTRTRHRPRAVDILAAGPRQKYQDIEPGPHVRVRHTKAGRDAPLHFLLPSKSADHADTRQCKPVDKGRSLLPLPADQTSVYECEQTFTVKENGPTLERTTRGPIEGHVDGSTTREPPPRCHPIVMIAYSRREKHKPAKAADRSLARVTGCTPDRTKQAAPDGQHGIKREDTIC